MVMKFIFTIALSLFVIILSAQETERIKFFDSSIVVDSTGRVTVTETIRVFANREQINRGIFRTLPLQRKGFWGEVFENEFEILHVKRDDAYERYHTDYSNNSVTIYIGKEDVTLFAGEYTYEIAYSLKPVVRFFEDHDEIYWNVTGNDWAFPIDAVHAMVTLPHNAIIQTGVSAYSGYAGDTGCACVINKNAQSQVEFVTTSPLQSLQGLTVAVPFNKGVVPAISEEEAERRFLSRNPHLIVAALGFVIIVLFYFIVWVMRGRDPKGRLNVPLFRPPENVAPYLMRYLHKMGFDNKVLIASITYLAQQGYLLVSENDDKGYTLTKTDQDQSTLANVEQALLSELFKEGNTLEVGRAYSPALARARYVLQKHLAKVRSEYFKTNSGFIALGVLLSAVTIVATALQLQGQEMIAGVFLTVFASLFIIACVGLTNACLETLRQKRYGATIFQFLFTCIFYAVEFFLLIFVVGAIGLFPVLVLLAITGVTIAAFYLLRAPTKAGKELMERIDDFAKFLTTAEIPRMEMLTSSMELDLSLFDRYLPFAIALDLETAWAGHFANIPETSSSLSRHRWYHSSSGAGTTIDFSSSFSNFTSSLSSSSSSSSSSGSSGGGSSGGGSGGGGGGGW